MSSRAGPELETLLGEAAFIRLAEAFGGTRLYVPTRMGPDHDIVAAIGMEAAAKLSDRMAPDVIRVPLAREARARHYRALGRSNARIAAALGITEPAVNRIFQRMIDVPAKNSALPAAPLRDPNQPDLFDRK